ncbi:MAG: TcpQ domain-containing protein [Acidiferrobacterales bacterium]
MNVIKQHGWVAALSAALVLGGCASVPNAPNAPGYAFGYRVHGERGAEVFSGTRNTYVLLPRGQDLISAAGDGRPRVARRDGPYWRVAGLAGTWSLRTSKGWVTARAPAAVTASITRMAATKVAATAVIPRRIGTDNHSPFRQVTRRFVIPFGEGRTHLSPEGEIRLQTAVYALRRAHKVLSLRVEGAASIRRPLADRATLASERARVVSRMLVAQGEREARNFGFSPGAGGAPRAVIDAVMEVRKPPKTVPGAHDGPALIPGHKRGGPEIARERIVFTGSRGELLSQALRTLATTHHWRLAWMSPADYAITYPVRLSGQTLVQVMGQVAAAWPVRVVFHQANRVIVVYGGINQ